MKKLMFLLSGLILLMVTSCKDSKKDLSPSDGQASGNPEGSVSVKAGRER